MRWLLILAAVLSLSCGWDWEGTCSGILTTELECAMICGTETTDYTWDAYQDSPQCGFCNCTGAGSASGTTSAP